MTTGEVTDPTRTPSRSAGPAGPVDLVDPADLAAPVGPVGLADPDGSTTELITADSA
jgi:hypothetical protein